MLFCKIGVVLVGIATAGLASLESCPLYFQGYVDEIDFFRTPVQSTVTPGFCKDFRTEKLCCPEEQYLKLNEKFSSRFFKTLDEIWLIKKYSISYFTYLVEYSAKRKGSYKYSSTINEKLQGIMKNFHKGIGSCLANVYAHEASLTCLYCSPNVTAFTTFSSQSHILNLRVSPSVCTLSVKSCSELLANLLTIYSVILYSDTGLRQVILKQGALNDKLFLSRQSKETIAFLRSYRLLKKCIIDGKCAELCQYLIQPFGANFRAVIVDPEYLLKRTAKLFEITFNPYEETQELRLLVQQIEEIDRGISFECKFEEEGEDGASLDSINFGMNQNLEIGFKLSELMNQLTKIQGLISLILYLIHNN